MSFRYLSTVSLSCAAICLLTQCNEKVASNEAGEEALAVVGGKTITAKDLVAEAEWRRKNHQAVPEPDVLLKQMVDRLALVDHAKQAGLETELETSRRIESLLIARLREQQLDTQLKKIEVTDEELAAAYESRLEEFTRPALDRFAILVQTIDSKASESRRKEARERIEEGISQSDANPATGGRGPAASGFGAVAIEFSDDQISRYRGGDIGWLAEGAEAARVPAGVLEAGRGLKKGGRSEVIETEEGFYVIMKSDSRPGEARPLEEVSGALRQALLREKKRAMEEQFLSDTRDSVSITLDSSAARQVELPDSSSPRPSQDEPPSFPAAAR